MFAALVVKILSCVSTHENPVAGVAAHIGFLSDQGLGFIGFRVV